MSDTVAIKEILNRTVSENIRDAAGPTALLLFGVALWYYSASENLFTFAAWGTLDLLMGISMFKAGSKKDAVLPIAYGVICAFVVAMIYRNGAWQWTQVETIALLGTIIACTCWRFLGATAAVIAFGVSVSIASIPILISTYHNPQTWEWWLWLGSGISASLGLYLSRPWTMKNIADWLFVSISEVVTIMILFLLLVRPLFF